MKASSLGAVACMLVYGCAQAPLKPSWSEPSAVHEQETVLSGDQVEQDEESVLAEVEPLEWSPTFPVENYAQPFAKSPRLTGDWGGARTELARKGLVVHLDVVTVGQSVLDGGSDEDSEILGKADLTAYMSTEHMGLWSGGFLSMRTEARDGRTVNRDVGSLLPVNTVGVFPADDLDESIIDVTELLYTQFLSERFAVFGGLMQTGGMDQNAFASGRGSEQFSNTAMVLNPVVFTGTPYSTLAVGVITAFSKDVYSVTVVATTEESSGKDPFDTNDGTTLANEVYFKYDLGGKPGGQMVGLIYAFDNDFMALDQEQRDLFPGGSVSTEDETWAITHNLYQYFQVNPSDPQRGWGMFTRFGTTDGDPNPVEWFWSAGLGGKGMFESRPFDRFGLGWYYVNLADENFIDALPIDNEQGVEVFYSYAVTPALHISADLQYIDVGIDSADDAFVGSIRLLMRL